MILNKDNIKAGELIVISFPNEKKYKAVKETEDGFGIVSEIEDTGFYLRMLTGNSKGKIRGFAFKETEYYPETFTKEESDDN